MLEELKTLTSLQAVSGHEDAIINWLKNKHQDVEFMQDNLGSLIFKIKGTNDNLKPQAIVCHMDEVGLVVSEILERGFIRFECVGGLTLESLVNQRVMIGDQKGVILGNSAHLKKETQDIRDLVIDCGFESKEEALEKIRIGDMISFDNNYQQLSTHRILSKALDNRVGVLVISQLIDAFKQHPPKRDTYFCASVQEEIGLRGAKTLMSKLPDDLYQVVVVDVSPLDDYPEAVDNLSLGKGPLLRIKDPYMVFDYDLINQARNLFEQWNINYQPYFSKGGTDSASIQLAGSGKKVLAICVGARNIHSNNSVIDVRDIKDTITFLYKYLLEEDYEKQN